VESRKYTEKEWRSSRLSHAVSKGVTVSMNCSRTTRRFVDGNQ
jgi:hypothetical protein